MLSLPTPMQPDQRLDLRVQQAGTAKVVPGHAPDDWALLALGRDYTPGHEATPATAA
jgi:hypothetical protein